MPNDPLVNDGAGVIPVMTVQAAVATTRRRPAVADAPRSGMLGAMGQTPPPAFGRFHVSAWIAGNGFGQLTVTEGVIEFIPGRLTRQTLRLRGSLTHRRRIVTMAVSPLGLGGMTLTLRADAVEDMLVQSVFSGSLKSWVKTWLPPTEPRPILFINVMIFPWQRRRLRKVLRTAGYQEYLERRWFVPFWRPVEPA